MREVATSAGAVHRDTAWPAEYPESVSRSTCRRRSAGSADRSTRPLRRKAASASETVGSDTSSSRASSLVSACGGGPAYSRASTILGLAEGEAHVIRNAGGVVTDDEIRSLVISQRLLGTTEIILIHHTDCGMLTFTDDQFKRAIQDETGIKPEWAAEAFTNLDEDVRQSIARIVASPFIPHKDAIRGFVFDVATGKLNEVI